MREHHTHAYIGITSCGCTVAAVERIGLKDFHFTHCPHGARPRVLPGRHLYEVHVFGIAYVMAEHEEDAQEVIEDRIVSVVDAIELELISCVATSIEPDWQLICPLVGEYDEAETRTCQEILAVQAGAAAEVHEEDPNQLSLDIGQRVRDE